MLNSLLVAGLNEFTYVFSENGLVARKNDEIVGTEVSKYKISILDFSSSQILSLGFFS